MHAILDYETGNRAIATRGAILTEKQIVESILTNPEIARFHDETELKTVIGCLFDSHETASL